ncbi:YdcF family protein [uncultured Merdimonas sp.]|uniref:YdcF family protein n=1 Tax=uncultured Merdimonas sp. TaxID=2023269 RepID=UPI00320951F1
MKKIKEWILGICGALLGVLGINLVIFQILFPAPKKRWEQDTCDCALVCGFHAMEDGTPSPVMKKRVEKAVELWKERKVRYLLLSGGAVANSRVEAEVMKKYALELGVPEQYLILEKRADCTYRNLKYGAATMKNCGFADCAVVTSGWHLRKADHYARKAGLRYVMVRADEPVEEGVLTTLRRYGETAVTMYRNFWKGYY